MKLGRIELHIAICASVLPAVAACTSEPYYCDKPLSCTDASRTSTGRDASADGPQSTEARGREEISDADRDANDNQEEATLPGVPPPGQTADAGSTPSPLPPLQDAAASLDDAVIDAASGSSTDADVGATLMDGCAIANEGCGPRSACSSTNGDCEEGCFAVDGSYSCSCAPPAVLATDKHRCLGWSPPVLLETDERGYASNPSVMFDANGNAIAVWHQWDGTRDNVWANRYVVDTGWGFATLLALGESDTYDVSLTLSGNGDAIAIWLQGEPGQEAVWASRFTEGAGWASAELLQDEGSGARRPNVGIDELGNGVATWAQVDGTISNVWTAHYVVGIGWVTPELLEVGDDSAYDTSLSVNSSGEAIAIWTQGGYQSRDAWARRYVPGNGWGSAVALETEEDGDVQNPIIGVDGLGGAIAVWLQFDGDRENVWANRYEVGTGWGVATMLETDDGHPNVPNLSVDSAGNAVAVWARVDASRSNETIWANRYSAGDGWGTAVTLGDAKMLRYGKPAIATNERGNAVALWSDNALYTARFVPGRGWSVPTTVGQDAPKGERVGVALDANDNAIAVWEQLVTDSGKMYNIQASRLE